MKLSELTFETFTKNLKSVDIRRHGRHTVVPSWRNGDCTISIDLDQAWGRRIFYQWQAQFIGKFGDCNVQFMDKGITVNNPAFIAWQMEYIKGKQLVLDTFNNHS